MTLYRKNETGSVARWEFLEIALIDEKTNEYGRRWRNGGTTREHAIMVSSHSGNVANNPNEHLIYFSDVAQAWFDEYEAGVKGSTALRTRSMIENHFLQTSMLGDVKMVDINVQLVQNVIDNLAEALKKHKRCVYYLSEIFKFAVRKGVIASNPVLNVSIPREYKAPPTKAQYWEREQVLAFLDIIEKEYTGQIDKIFIFFRLLAFTGMRKGELMALRWGDVDLDRREVSITKTVSRDKNGKQVITSPKTSTSNRAVILDAQTCRILRQYRSFVKAKNCQLVVPNEEGNPLGMTKGDKWLKHIIEKYNLVPMTVHGFRHTFASLAKDAGLDELQVQYQLGHVDVRTTLQYYVHLTNRAKREGIKKFSHYMNG